MTALIGPVAAAACLASGLGIARLLGRVRQGQPLVPPLPVNPVTWGGATVVYLLLLFMLCQFSVQLVFQAIFPAPVGAERGVSDASLAAYAVSMLGFTLLATVLLRKRGASVASLGFRDPQPLEGLWLAVLTWIIIVPPILAIAAFLDHFVVSYSHPVVDYLQQDRSPAAIGLVLLTAVVAAPIGEEFFFRRVLQGWLEPQLGGRAVVVSAVCFGLAHLGHGLGWIPLIGFGLATGYLARQRGTILPSIVVHALFNGVSVLLLLVPQAAAGGTG
jgi:membrane protease YdiL (CAAX protease family)